MNAAHDPHENSTEAPEAGLLSNLPHDEPPADVDPETGEILSAPQQTWTETCTRCGGTGWWNGRLRCMSCGGTGRREFKTSPEQRAARKAASPPTPEGKARYQQQKTRQQEREEELGRQRWEDFEQRQERAALWIRGRIDGGAREAGYNFAVAMDGAVRRFGSLTPNQMAAVGKWIDGAERRAMEQVQAEFRAQPVHSVNLEAVEQAFERARRQGIKYPKLTLDGFALSPAKETSANAGAIYVTEGARDGTYLGKVMRGEFLPVRACTDDIKAKVLEAMADPLASAIAYGKKFGRCAVCRRELSDPESIERGIGPVCQERLFGGG